MHLKQSQLWDCFCCPFSVDSLLRCHYDEGESERLTTKAPLPARRRRLCARVFFVLTFSQKLRIIRLFRRKGIRTAKYLRSPFHFLLDFFTNAWRVQMIEMLRSKVTVEGRSIFFVREKHAFKAVFLDKKVYQHFVIAIS